MRTLVGQFNNFFSEVADLDKAWTKLVNALSGQFCASLNFLDASQAISPSWSFQPRGLSPLGLNSSSVSARFRSGPNVIKLLLSVKMFLTC
jgi:hypothetical protein